MQSKLEDYKLEGCSIENYVRKFFLNDLFYQNHRAENGEPALSEIKLLLLYSGGIDSSVLLRLLIDIVVPKIGMDNLHLLHVNYHLRLESTKDELWVRTLAKNLKLALTVESAPLNTLLKKKEETGKSNPIKGNIQGKARKIRYQLAQKIMQAKGIHYLITGHHFDDALENFHLKQLKGQSTKAIQNIFSSQNSPTLVANHLKPLLPFTKDSLIQYAKEKKISFCNDTSNDKTSYERNYLRNIVFPSLDKKFPAWKKNTYRFQQSINTQTQLLEKLILNHKIILVDPPLIKINMAFYGYSLTENEKIWLLHFYLNQVFPEERFSEAAIHDYFKKISLSNGMDLGVLFNSKKWGEIFYNHWIENFPKNSLEHLFIAPIKAFDLNHPKIKQLLSKVKIYPPILPPTLWQPLTSSDLKLKMQGSRKTLKSVLSEYKVPLLARKAGLILKTQSPEENQQVIAFLNPLLAFSQIYPELNSPDRIQENAVIHFGDYDIVLS